MSEFWRTKELEEMNAEEWESLCDGCAKCCLIKLQDEDTEQLVYTNVTCRLLDSQACRCTRYADRSVHVPTCLVLTPALVRSIDWLPDTCAYRLVRDGEPLAQWHPLVSGNANSTVLSGNSVAGRVVSEDYVHPDALEDHVIQWVE